MRIRINRLEVTKGLLRALHVPRHDGDARRSGCSKCAGDGKPDAGTCAGNDDGLLGDWLGVDFFDHRRCSGWWEPGARQRVDRSGLQRMVRLNAIDVYRNRGVRYGSGAL